jgi:hypothetical protein
MPATVICHQYRADTYSCSLGCIVKLTEDRSLRKRTSVCKHKNGIWKTYLAAHVYSCAMYIVSMAHNRSAAGPVHRLCAAAQAFYESIAHT